MEIYRNQTKDYLVSVAR